MIKNKYNYVTSAEAAELLGFSHDYVRKLILQGKIQAEKLGRNWVIEKNKLNKIHRQRQRFSRTKEQVKDGSYQR